MASKSIRTPIYAPVAITMRDTLTGASVSITVRPKGETLAGVARTVRRGLPAHWLPTSVDDRRHKRR